MRAIALLMYFSSFLKRTELKTSMVDFEDALFYQSVVNLCLIISMLFMDFSGHHICNSSLQNVLFALV